MPSSGEDVDGTGLRISLLGELTATGDDGGALDLGGPRQRAVLALLLLARGDVVPAERLAESVWGDDPPGNVTGALQSYVSHLRRRLEPAREARRRSGVIVSEGPGYAVRLPPDAVDAWRFEALLQQAEAGDDPRQAVALLQQALDLWSGPALLEYTDEPWAAAEVARLTDLRAHARERLLAARLASGQAALLVPELEALVAEEPLREERWRLLVLALYRAQRQADALAALRRARETLAEELGVDPGPALRALEAEVLAQSPSLDAPVLAEAPRPPVPAPRAAPPGDELVDRDGEVAALHAALDDLARGEPRLLLVEGPAGIGKSRLLAELRTQAAARSCRVLTARGSQLEKAFAFGAVRQLFEPELLAHDARDALLSGAAASARGVFDLVDGGGALGDGDSSFAALHGLYWLTVNLSGGGPVVLAVDDLQWCDSGSLRYLAYLVRRLEGLPVLVVGTVRTGERHDDEELLVELSLDPSTLVLRPAPLSTEATAALVRQRLGDDAAPAFVAACHGTTSGNPLLLRQLLRGLESAAVRPDAAHADTVMAIGSRAVSSMVLMRMRRMPADAVAVARAVATLGEGAALPVVTAMAGLAEDDAVTALGWLTRGEVVRDEQPLGFVHPLVRDAVYRDVPAAERELAHERAARVLRATGASVEQVAAHLLLAPHRGDPETVAVLRRSARTAAERGASDSAVTYLRRALAEPPAGPQLDQVLHELGLAETSVDGPAGVEHLLAAYRGADDPDRRAELALHIARTQVFASPAGTATAFAREAAAALPADRDDARQGLLALQRISGFMQGLPQSQWAAEPAREPVGGGSGALMLAATLSWEELVGGTDRDRAIALARAALVGDALWEVDNGLLWVVAANVRELADDDLGDFWQRARMQAHARGSLFMALSVNLWQGYGYWRRGELADAMACMRACDEQNRMWGTLLGNLYSLAFAIRICLDRGDVAAARERADQVLAAQAPGDGGRICRQAVARVLLAEGRPAPGIPNPVWEPWRGLRAEALHALGQSDAAVALALEEVALLRRWGAPTALGPALRLLGEVSGPAGLVHLREAVDLLAATPARLELARARCALGGSPDVPDAEAVPLLQAAAQEAAACGAVAVRDEAGAALARRGRAVPDHEERAHLSATDRLVLDLTANGLSVREVAQRLFLAPGTVRAVLEAAEAAQRPASSRPQVLDGTLQAAHP